LNPLTGGQGDFFQCFLTRQEMTEVVFGSGTQCNLRIGQTQIGVKEHHIVTALGQGHCQVDGHRGFTHAALATGDANDFCGFVLSHE
jgi:hypothetical protein